jgi:hypothetical protein
MRPRSREAEATRVSLLWIEKKAVNLRYKYLLLRHHRHITTRIQSNLMPQTTISKK